MIAYKDGSITIVEVEENEVKPTGKVKLRDIGDLGSDVTEVNLVEGDKCYDSSTTTWYRFSSLGTWVEQFTIEES